MHIRDIFASNQTTLSFEFFPPKTAADAEVLYENIARLLKGTEPRIGGGPKSPVGPT